MPGGRAGFVGPARALLLGSAVRQDSLGAFYLFAYLFSYLPFHTTLLIFLTHSFICIYFVSLGYSCFIMLHQLLLRGEGNQPYVYAYPLPFGFPSRPGHHRA